MEDCIFCKIAKHELPAKIRYENEEFIAFDDINPSAPVDILLIPKRHIASIKDLTGQDNQLMGNLLLAVKEVAKDNKLDAGFRLVVNTGNDAGQVIFHLHAHILGGRKLGPIA